MHIALLGDSIFDNKSYTSGEPDVVSHLRGLLTPPDRVTLLAIDGNITADLARQIAKVPEDVSHLVVSVGGNDALQNADLLDRPVRSTAAALSLLAERLAHFESAYRAAIDAARALDRDTTVCTIYNGNLDPVLARVARIALMMFNDVILRVAVERGLGVIELRLICTEPSDYANPIEPSGSGGLKIAKAIARSVSGQARTARVSAG